MSFDRSLVISIVLILTGVGGLLFFTYDSPGNLKPVWGSDLKTSFQSNGERIYYTGYNDLEERIPTTRGPMWLYMHGGGCVDCHGVNGRGGVPVMMGVEIPPDITYDALTGEHGEEEEHPPYTNESIKTAIKDGLDPAGEPLDPTMPRWQMSDADLDDMVEYLKTL
ncbi:MAG: cytochrome c [Methanosarcinales archaeon]|nr:cytochrome c [ANME-2 cluster archaeon]MDW7776706.1 cytochrome c [Methanosarcinales archaeon]